MRATCPILVLLLGLIRLITFGEVEVTKISFMKLMTSVLVFKLRHILAQLKLPVNTDTPHRTGQETYFIELIFYRHLPNT
jgi:hypothetical protein